MPRGARQERPGLISSDTLKAAASGDPKAVAAGGEKALLEVVAASHSGMTVAEFQAAARKWLETAKHPSTGRPYIEHVYQPMLELLSYLRDKDFEVYIASGGKLHFVRAFAEDVYGVPPQNVIGSVGEAAYVPDGGSPRIIKEPGIAFIDDKAGKPAAIDGISAFARSSPSAIRMAISR